MRTKQKQKLQKKVAAKTYFALKMYIGLRNQNESGLTFALFFSEINIHLVSCILGDEGDELACCKSNSFNLSFKLHVINQTCRHGNIKMMCQGLY